MVVVGSFILSAMLALADPREATVVVQSLAGLATQTGAGVIVSMNDRTVEILTVAHIFRDGTGEVQTTSGQVGFFPGRSGLTELSAIEDVKFSSSSDLALVSVRLPVGLQIGPVRMATMLPKVGDALTVVGNPQGTDLFALSPARVVLLRVATFEFAFSCTTCAPGDSGGGVFNANGELVGIDVGAARIDDDRGNVVLARANFSQPVANIERFLAGLWTF